MIEESDLYKYNFLVHSTRLTFCWNLHWYSSIPCYCLCEYLWISLGEANVLFSIVCLSCFSKRGKQQNEKFIFRDGVRGGNELSRWWIELILTIVTGYNRSCRQIRHQLLQRENHICLLSFLIILLPGRILCYWNCAGRRTDKGLYKTRGTEHIMLTDTIATSWSTSHQGYYDITWKH